jgi:Family of unknown function (DUF6934)
MLALTAYPYKTNSSYFDYSFDSVGPKGIIRKIARFSLIGNNVYNFAFGDLDDKTGDVNDLTKSANGDIEKILATLAEIIVEFLSVYPWTRILIRGSTAARTRLYQLHINKYQEDISGHLLIWGYREGQWEVMEQGRNYESFLGELK